MPKSKMKDETMVKILSFMFSVSILTAEIVGLCSGGW